MPIAQPTRLAKYRLPLDGTTRLHHLPDTGPRQSGFLPTQAHQDRLYLMLRLSKLSDYAVVVLVRLSRADGCQTSPCLAAMTGLPEPTVAKVLKHLTSGGLVNSQRGARGGYRLSRPLTAIAVADVVTAIDGPIAIAACIEGGNGRCEVEAQCGVRGRWDPVNTAVLDALSRITLADMAAAAPPKPRNFLPAPPLPDDFPLPAE